MGGRSVTGGLRVTVGGRAEGSAEENGGERPPLETGKGPGGRLSQARVLCLFSRWHSTLGN